MNVYTFLYLTSCRKCKFHYLPICEATNWAITRKPYSNDAKVKKTLQSQVSRQDLLCFFSGNVAPACQTAHLQEKHLLPNLATRHVKSAGKVNHFGQFGSRCFRTRYKAYICKANGIHPHRLGTQQNTQIISQIKARQNQLSKSDVS